MTPSEIEKKIKELETWLACNFFSPNYQTVLADKRFYERLRKHDDSKSIKKENYG